MKCGGLTKPRARYLGTSKRTGNWNGVAIAGHIWIQVSDEEYSITSLLYRHAIHVDGFAVDRCRGACVAALVAQTSSTAATRKLCCW